MIYDASKVGEEGITLNDPLVALQQCGICLSARQRGRDVNSLREGLDDALRQTPTCFYVGEVRDQNQWREIVDFAGTGHLIVTTTHAGSLTETFGKIFSAVGAQTSQQRREVASRIRLCAHLVMKELIFDESGERSQKNVLPEVWVNIRDAVNSMVSDGLGSLIPNNRYVLSRSQFLRHVAEQHRELRSRQFFQRVSEQAEDLDIGRISQ